MFDDGVSPVPYLIARWFEMDFDPVPRVYNFAPFVKRATSTDKSPKISESALLDYIASKTAIGEIWNKRSSIGYTEGELVQFRDALEIPRNNNVDVVEKKKNQLLQDMEFVQNEIEKIKEKPIEDDALVTCGDFLDENYVDIHTDDDLFGCRADMAQDQIVQKIMEMRGFEKRIEAVFHSENFKCVRFYDSILRLSARVYEDTVGKPNSVLMFKQETVKFDVLSTKTISGRQLVFIDDYVPHYEKNKNNYTVDVRSGFFDDWISYYHLGDRKLAMDCMEVIKQLVFTAGDLRNLCKSISFACLQMMLKIDVESLKPYFYRLPDPRLQDILIYMVKNEKINHRTGNDVIGPQFFKKEFGVQVNNDSKIPEYRNCVQVNDLIDSKNKNIYYMKWRNLKTVNNGFNYLRVYIANHKRDVCANARKANVVMYLIFSVDIAKYEKVSGRFLFCDKKIFDFSKGSFNDVAFCMNQDGRIKYIK